MEKGKQEAVNEEVKLVKKSAKSESVAKVSGNKKLTSEELQALLWEWKFRLYLHEWNLHIYYERSMKDIAESRYTPRIKEGNIVLIDPVDYKTVSDFCGEDERDQEAEIVHELLHLKFANIAPKEELAGKSEVYRLTPEDYFEETVETMARILVRMKRGEI